MQTLATQMGREGPINIIGTVSEKEARDALRKHKGNVWDAVTECVDQRQRKVTFSKQTFMHIVLTYFSSMESWHLEVNSPEKT